MVAGLNQLLKFVEAI